MEKTESKYIYCIIRKPKSLETDLCGISRKKVHLVNHQQLAAVVSDAQVKDYPITRENTIIHQQIIEKIMEYYGPVLPVSFGTVAENSQVIQKKLLGPKYDEMLQSLRNLEGKAELNLKAIWLDMPKIFQKIVAESPELSRIKQTMLGEMLGRDDAIEVGKAVAAAVESRREKIKGNIFDLLKDITVDHKETPLLGEEMIFNLAFLVPEKKQKTFDKIVRNLDEQYVEENVYFKYIGPIPPFNFVSVSISLN